MAEFLGNLFCTIVVLCVLWMALSSLCSFISSTLIPILILLAIPLALYHSSSEAAKRIQEAKKAQRS